MTQERKESLQYITAMSTLFSGIQMCFLSFFLTNEHIIDASILMYFGETLIFTGAVFGLNIMIKTKVLEAESKIREDVDKKLETIDRLMKPEDQTNTL